MCAIAISKREKETPVENAALGAGYALSIAPDATYPDPGGALTDGAAPFLFAAGPGCWAPGELVVDVDLGAPTEGIAVFAAHFLRSDISAVASPDGVEVLVSPDGVAFTAIGALEPMLDEDETVNVWLLEAPASARYVRFAIDEGSGWLFCAEVAVYREL